MEKGGSEGGLGNGGGGGEKGGLYSWRGASLRVCLRERSGISFLTFEIAFKWTLGGTEDGTIFCFFLTVYKDKHVPLVYIPVSKQIFKQDSCVKIKKELG